MRDVQTALFELSKQAQNIADFLKRACRLLKISYRSASLRAGLSHGTIWSLVSGKVKHGDPETLAKLALYFGVPEINLLRLAGYTPQYVNPSPFPEEVTAVFHSLTPDEIEDWIRYGKLLIRAREPKPPTP